MGEMLAAMGGAEAAAGAAEGASTAGTLASGSAATGTALNGSLANAYAPAASATPFPNAASPAMSAMPEPGVWSKMGSSIAQFGDEIKSGYKDPLNTSNIGFNGQTLGQMAAISRGGGPVAMMGQQKSQGIDENMVQSYLQRIQQERDQQSRGY